MWTFGDVAELSQEELVSEVTKRLDCADALEDVLQVFGASISRRNVSFSMGLFDGEWGVQLYTVGESLNSCDLRQEHESLKVAVCRVILKYCLILEGQYHPETFERKYGVKGDD